MTYYNEQIIKISNENLPKPYLIDRVIKAKHTIDNYYCHDIDLNFISGEAFLSKYHLIRIFKNCYGTTPYQLITERRVQKAVELLTNGFNVSETCAELGFESAASFSIYFKKHLGKVPTDFKKAISNKLQ